ncbi:MAG TPA: gliding motility protein GldC [Ignavibacteriaceae bacterium]|jgi:gliding motility-associated protein GldC|nr:gliding motility protein GldC [Ignavibacteriaceae bacterium]
MIKNSEILLHIELDEKKVPVKIEWSATDSGFDGKRESKSMMLSLWDKQENATMGIDLWTKEMMVEDMNVYFHQTFLKMADTYRRATKNEEVAQIIENFSADFADKLELSKKVNKSSQ